MATTEKKYLSLVGLQAYDAKIKALIDTKDEAVLQSAKDYADGLAVNYDAAGTAATQINILVTEGQVKTNTDAIAAINNADTGILKQAKDYADGKDEAIAAAKAAGDAAQADVDALKLKVGEVAEGKTVVGLIGEAQAKAEQGVTDAATAQAKADEAYDLANGKATMTEVNDAIAGAGHAVKSEVDAAIEQLGKDYVAADTALETRLQGNIDKKVDQTAYDTKVGELVAEDVRLAGLISDMDTEYKKADTALDGRIATLEGTITGLSGAMHFKGVKNEIPADVTGYADGDVIIVGDKEYVFNDGSFVEFGDVSAEGERIAVLEGIVGEEAEGENAATGLVKAVADNTAAIAAEKTRAEGKEAELVQADIDNLAAAKEYTDDEIGKIDLSGIETNAGAISGLTGRIDAIEASLAEGGDTADAIANAQKAADDAQADVDALTADDGKITILESEMDAVEGRLGALESVSFVEITTDEIDAMFNPAV